MITITGAGDANIPDGNYLISNVLVNSYDFTVSVAPTTSPGTLSAASAGLDVQPGQEVIVSAAYTLNFLRVQVGGSIVLADNTIFLVAGDVEIAGDLRTARSVSSIDAHDLTIIADGIVNITGQIDCSGFAGSDGFLFNEPSGPGGDGGEIFIGGTLSSAPGPQVFLSGRVTANGGDTFAAAGLARTGRGGQILIGTGGSMTVTGEVSAHGGFSHRSDFPGADGGEIQLIAEAGLEVGGLTEITASGGDTRGPIAGDGGTILLEALGSVILWGFALNDHGGTTVGAGTAGQGGTVTITADVVDIDNVTVDSSGGTAPEITGAIGGSGGAIELAGFTALDVAVNAEILAHGGRSQSGATPAGPGGDISVINLDETNLVAMNFLGVASVAGGLDELGIRAADGTICERGAGPVSSLILTGTTNFPIATCQTVAFPVHDLDCDIDTIIPDTVSTELPTITGREFFRVHVGASSSVTISTTGEVNRDLDLYAGGDTALGSANTGFYAFSSTNLGSTESLTIDLTTFNPGQFVSVFVAEQSEIVEAYTITVGCN